MNNAIHGFPWEVCTSIWAKVCKKFGIKTLYDHIHWIYRDDALEIQNCYEELYVEQCNQIIQTLLQEVV